MTTGAAPADTLKATVVKGAAETSRPRFDPRYIAPLLITCVLIGANLYGGVLESLPRTALAIVTAILTEMIAGWITNGKIPHLASAYVTGISVGILVRSPWFWPYAVCAAISILSKYVLRVKGRHIWNPSNFGIVWLLFLVPQTVAPLSIQWGNSLPPMIIIWVLGSFVIYRAKRFHICATYVASFLLFAALRCPITHQSFWAEVAPITGPMYQLFTFFMITDPKTTVKSKKGQIVVTVIIAFVECVLRLDQFVDAPFYALFLVGPIANLLEIQKTAKTAGDPNATPPAAEMRGIGYGARG